MDATLKLKNKPNVIGAASNFTYHWGINSGLNQQHATRLAVAVSELVTDVVLFAFGEHEGEMEITFQRHEDSVEVIMHELGEPFNPDRHRYDRRRAVEEGDFDGAGFELVRRLTDEFIYLNKGKLGKEFRLVHRISSPHITELLPMRELNSAADLPQEPEHYHILPITADDAEDISKLIYRTYRHTYYKDKLYFPRQIALMIEQRDKFGVITRNRRGEPVGFFALLITTDSDICEIGEAVVAVKHRRKGIMTRMLDQLLETARERGFLGAFGEATAAHEVSQRVNARFGMQTTALLLAVSPAMALSGFEEKTRSQDVSSFLEFLPLATMPPRAVYLPDEYRDLIDGAYRLLGIETVPGIVPADEALPEVSVLDIEIEYEDRFALIIVRRYGSDFETQLAMALRDLDENQIATIAVDLPLGHWSTPRRIGLLHGHGFIYCGLMPLFHQERDYLRLQRTHSTLDFGLINAFSPMARRIKALVQKEYHEASERRKQTVH